MKVVLYGFGQMGQKLYHQFKQQGDVTVHPFDLQTLKSWVMPSVGGAAGGSGDLAGSSGVQSGNTLSR